MKLNEIIIEEIGKKLKIGMYAKEAARCHGITERAFYKWKSEGNEILKKITNKQDEIIDEEFKKLTHTEKLKIQFIQSIGQAEAEAEAMLLARVVSASDDDWKAAMQILQRRWPQRWAQKDYLHVDGEITEQPDKLKEIEDELFADVPESGMKDLVKGIGKLIKDASTNGRPAPEAKG